MREKLIEFIRKADKEDYESRTQDEHYAYMADSLIANGVTIPVRCKDCEHCVCGYCAAEIDGIVRLRAVKEDDFCAWGERKDNERKAD